MAQLTIDQAFELALQHHRGGRLAEAEKIYRQILAGQPDHPDALHLLGVVATANGHGNTAVELIRRALTGRPSDAGMYGNLGSALKSTGRLDEAVAAYRRAIELDPRIPDNHNNLGATLQELKRPEEAIAAHRRAIALRPGFAEAEFNLGVALSAMGNQQEAIAAYRQAVALRPKFAEAYSNLGNALKASGELDAAIDAHRQAVSLNPTHAPHHSNLGTVLADAGQLDAAIASYRQAIALKPDLADARYNLAMALLTKGDLREGFEQYEWRWRSADFPSPRRDFSQPQWDGSPLQGRTLLIHAEQGLGDTMQFVRYLPMIVQLIGPGRVVLECQPQLLRLFRPLANGCELIARGQPLPAFDLHCPLLSLPRALGSTLENLPRQVPYLHPDPGDVDIWRQRLAGGAPLLRVGLVWAGNPAQGSDRRRSITLAHLAPLARVPKVQFISLQKDSASVQAQSPPPGLQLLDPRQQLRDMADTAALIANLDLVIGVCTSVIHLAGGMGKPVWTLLSCPADWRWLVGRDDSPWYPTMRLFRQSAPGDWDGVIGRVTEALFHLRG